MAAGRKFEGALASAAALACLLPAAALADPGADAPVADALAVNEESVLFREIPVVYAASKYEQRVTDAPSSVSIVTAADIQHYGYRTLSDILRAVRGFYVTYDRNYSYLGVRGFGRPGDYNSRVLLLVDGHRINDDVYSQGLLGTEFPVDVDLIDRIEVIRGPGSAIYGTDAFFAVVNIVLKQARSFQTAEVSGEAGSEQTYKARASYSHRFESGPELLLSATDYHSAGAQSLFFPEYATPATNNGVSQGRDGDAAQYFLANAKFGDFNLRYVSGSRDKDVPTASFGTVFDRPGEATVDTRQYLDLKFQRRLEDDSEVTARVYADYYRYHGDYPEAVPGPGAQVDTNYDALDGRWAGAETQYTARFWEHHRVTLGGEFIDNYRQNQENWNLDPYELELDSRMRSKSWALYGQDEYAITPTLTLNAGVRYDELSAIDASATSPRLGLVDNPDADTTLKLLYGTAFRAPNAYELYYNSPAVGFDSPVSLQPERITTAEAVFERNLSANVRGMGSVFRNHIERLINLTTDAAGNYIFGNLDRVTSQGVELEVDGNWSHGIETRASLVLERATDDLTGAKLSNSPDRLATFNLVAPILASDVFAGAEVLYVGPVLTVSTNSLNTPNLPQTLGGYALANLTLFHRGLHNGVELSASIYNVFNKGFAEPGAQWEEPAIAQDGRLFRFKITVPLAL
jgi:iron complex outermembrane receptor protein